MALPFDAVRVVFFAAGFVVDAFFGAAFFVEALRDAVFFVVVFFVAMIRLLTLVDGWAAIIRRREPPAATPSRAFRL